jgi:hypothetical protein
MSLVIISGAIANKCRKGGAAWTRLCWVLGLQQLGFQVHFLEQIDRQACLDSAGTVTRFEESAQLGYFRTVIERFGLVGSATLINGQGSQTYGLSWAELLDLVGAADLLVNISGHLTIEALRRGIRRKVYVDQDPGFTQFWHASGNDGARLHGHDAYFTVGENIGKPSCPIPTSGIKWHATRQPVVLAYWPVSRQGEPDRFTTVASWRGPYGRIQHNGSTYGLKAHEFRRFLELPRRSRQRFEIALDIHPADQKDLDALCDHGWHVVDPKEVAPDPPAFQSYVQSSSAEFSVAHGVYVGTNSGWFSDRTVRYLASGRPALVQDTGFSGNYPVGEGLIAFRTLEDAIAGAGSIVGNYGSQCRAARALAEAYFDSDKVLGRFLEEVGVAP